MLVFIETHQFRRKMFIFAVYDYVFDYIIVFIGICNQIIVEEFINIRIDLTFD